MGFFKSRRGHRYVTVVLDADTSKLLLIVEGRHAQTLSEFACTMPAHGASPDQISEVVMDMSAAYIAGTRENFPKARIVFDHFHLMQLAGKACDEVRKSLSRNGADLCGGLWSLRGNQWTRSQEQLFRRQQLCRDYPKIGRAIALRQAFQDVLAGSHIDSLHWWRGWAARSRLSFYLKASRLKLDLPHPLPI